jgi:hypothetical protein
MFTVVFLLEVAGGVVLELEYLDFGDAQAAEGPLAVDEVVDEGAGFGSGGAVVVVILVDELLEVGKAFVGEDQGAGLDAGFEGILAGGGFTCDRGGAGGLPGVTTVGSSLIDRVHGFAREWTGREACPTLSIDGGIWVFGGVSL